MSATIPEDALGVESSRNRANLAGVSAWNAGLPANTSNNTRPSTSSAAGPPRRCRTRGRRSDATPAGQAGLRCGSIPAAWDRRPVARPATSRQRLVPASDHRPGTPRPCPLDPRDRRFGTAGRAPCREGSAPGHRNRKMRRTTFPARTAPSPVSQTSLKLPSFIRASSSLYRGSLLIAGFAVSIRYRVNGINVSRSS